MHRNRKVLGDGGRHCRRGPHARCAGAGVGVTAIDDDGATAMLTEMPAIEKHRCGDDTILGKDSCDRTGDGGYDECQVENARFFDAAMDAGCFKALRSGDAQWSGIHGGNLSEGYSRKCDVEIFVSRVTARCCESGLLRDPHHKIHGLNRLTGGTFDQIIDGCDGDDPSGARIRVDTDVTIV